MNYSILLPLFLCFSIPLLAMEFMFDEPDSLEAWQQQIFYTPSSLPSLESPPITEIHNETMESTDSTNNRNLMYNNEQEAEKDSDSIDPLPPYQITCPNCSRQISLTSLRVIPAFINHYRIQHGSKMSADEARKYIATASSRPIIVTPNNNRFQAVCSLCPMILQRKVYNSALQQISSHYREKHEKILNHDEQKKRIILPLYEKKWQVKCPCLKCTFTSSHRLKMTVKNKIRNHIKSQHNQLLKTKIIKFYEVQIQNYPDSTNRIPLK